MKIVIAIPTAGRVPMGFAYSLASLTSMLSAEGCPSAKEAVEFSMDIMESSNWIHNREVLVSRAIKSDATHILFLDDDMIFSPYVLDLLVSRNKHIVCTNYMIKKEPPEFTAVDFNGKRIATTKESTGIEPISHSGFGVSLFNLDVFKKIPQPWFLPEFDMNTKTYSTEDTPFYEKAWKSGFTVYLDHDASKMLSHVGQKIWNWREYA